MKSILSAALLGLVSRASAQIATACISSDVCYGLNIPAGTASSGNGDVFFQISAPSTYKWVALGQGTGMTGSNIFVVYTSNGGKNVTLSPRLGTGHVEPQFNSKAEVSLLDGSGISNGKMIANVKCSNCQSWSGGSMDFTSSSGKWIHAFQSSGGALNSDDTSATISQHGNGDASAFSWDFTNAKGGNSVNPFTAVSASGSGTVAGATGTSSCVPRPTTGTFANAAATNTWPSTIPSEFASAFPTGFPSEWQSNWPTAKPTGSYNWNKRDTVNYCDSPSSVNGNGNAFTVLSSLATRETKMLIAHGVMAALAFVILFPVGAISIRLLNFPGLVWFHAAFQAFAYLVFLVAFGLGVSIANTEGVLSEYHPIIGIVLFVLIFFQPIFGFLHHSLYKKHNSRTLSSYVHLWLGRIVITLGIINGGLGFMLADTLGAGSHTGMIVYAVVAAIVWLAYVLAIVLGERRRARMAHDNPPKYSETSYDTPLAPINPPAERAESPGAQGYYSGGHNGPKNQ